MSLFELSRVWDVWPQLTGSQVLRDLYRQAPTRFIEEKICHVFAAGGHLFVGTKTDNRDRLYGFSTSGGTVDGQEEGKSVSVLPISSGGGQAVAVFRLEDNICVVRAWGQLEMFSFEECGWKQRASTWLSKDHILCCVFNDASHSVVYCTTGSGDGHLHEVFICQCRLQDEDEEKRNVCLGEAVQLLSDCPEVELWSWKEGVAVLPRPAPPGLLLLWLPALSSSQLQPFILGDNSPVALICSSHFPTLCLQLFPFWSKASKEDGRWLMSVTVNIDTKQLLLLLSSGEIITVHLSEDRVESHCVTKLKDFPNHFPHTKSGSTDLLVFSFHTYCGVFSNGDIRLYEIFSGEMIWECGDHEGHRVSLLAPPFSQSWIGICGDSGVWMLRSHRVSKHAQLLSQALFPIATNADETTPGDYLEDGQVLAATLYLLWNLPLPATRSALEALLGIVQREREQQQGDEEVVDDSDMFLPQLSPELKSVLRSVCLHSPALIVALLAEHPQHRHFVDEAVESYLLGLQSGTATRISKEVAPLLMQYSSLSHDYESQVATSTSKEILPNPSALTTSLLRRLESCPVNDRVGIRAQLEMLSFLSPKATLSGLKSFFGVLDFSVAAEAIEAGNWHPCHDWKSLFGVEVASEVERKSLESVPLTVPLFELTCRLLYREDPKELVPFVAFAQLARDYQAEGDSAFARRCRKAHFSQRAVQCLPTFLSNEATPASRESLLAHSNLLLHSELNGCEGSALRLLLKGQLWEDAVIFVERQTSHTSHTYCTLLHSLMTAMAQNNVLHTYIDRVWKLVPSNFSVFDMLGVLSHSTVQPLSPLVPHHTSLTVSDIGSRLLQLLPTTNYTFEPEDQK